MLQLLRRLCSSRVSLGGQRLLHPLPSASRPAFQRFEPFTIASNIGLRSITTALPIPGAGSRVLLLGGLTGSLLYAASPPTACAEEVPEAGLQALYAKLRDSLQAALRTTASRSSARGRSSPSPQPAKPSTPAPRQAVHHPLVRRGVRPYHGQEDVEAHPQADGPRGLGKVEPMLSQLSHILENLDEVSESQARNGVIEYFEVLKKPLRDGIQSLRETDCVDPQDLWSLDRKVAEYEAELEPLLDEMAEKGCMLTKGSGCARLLLNYFTTLEAMEDKEAIATVAAQAGICMSMLVEFSEICKRVFTISSAIEGEIKAVAAKAAAAKDK